MWNIPELFGIVMALNWIIASIWACHSTKLIIGEIKNKGQNNPENDEFIELIIPSGQPYADLDAFCIIVWVRYGHEPLLQAEALGVYQLGGYTTNEDGLFLIGGDAFSQSPYNLNSSWYYNTNQINWMPESGTAEIVVGVYYGGACDAVTQGNSYNQMDILNGIVDAVPTTTTEELLNIFDPVTSVSPSGIWDQDDVISINSGAKSASKCDSSPLECFAQFSLIDECWCTNSVPSPGVIPNDCGNNCPNKGSGNG